LPFQGERLEMYYSDGKPCSGVRGDQQVSTARQDNCVHAALRREAVHVQKLSSLKKLSGGILS